MKYKAGDVVKLRDDLEDGKKYGTIRYAREMDFIKGKPMELIAKTTVFENCYITKDENDVEWYISDEMIQGLWGECKGITYEPYKEKPNKYKLIEVLNKIANGELKEGTKVNLIADDYLKKLYYDGELIRFVASDNIYAFTPKDINDEDEYELIEPNHFADVGGMAKHLREDAKMIEPTDNTTEKIEELKQLDMDFAEIDFSSHEEYARCAIQVLARKMTKQIDKLNEVIRKLNKEDNNE